VVYCNFFCKAFSRFDFRPAGDCR